MSGNSGIINTGHEADISIAVLWQYQNATRLKKLISGKQKWLDVNHRQFWENWTMYVFGALSLDADTARHLSEISDPENPAYNPQSPDFRKAQLWLFGLTVWGKILNLPREYYFNGNSQQLDSTQYQSLLRGQFFKNIISCTIPEINRWLKIVFKGYGNAYVIDNGSMSMYICIDFAISEKFYQALTQLDILPKPAGVGISLLVQAYSLTLYAEEYDGTYMDRDTLSGDYDENGQTVEGNPGGILASYVEL